MRLKAIKKYKSAGKVVVPGSRFQGKLIRPIEVVVLRLPHCATYDGASRSYREMVPEVEARATPDTTSRPRNQANPDPLPTARPCSCGSGTSGTRSAP